MDVYLTNESVMDIEDTVPESYHFIILDSKGELLYSRLDKEAGSEEVARYLAELTAGVEDGSLFAYDATITGPDGRNRGVYYAVMNNGWSVIITVPLEDILMGADSPLVGILAAISIMLFLILTILVFRDLRNRKRYRPTATRSIFSATRSTPSIGWTLTRRPTQRSKCRPI